MAEKNETDKNGEDGFNIDKTHKIVQMMAIILAGVWGIYTFIYQSKIVPSLARPTLSVTSRIEKAGQREDMVAVHTTVTRTDVGQTSVRLLGYTVNVVGIKEGFLKKPEKNPVFTQSDKQSSIILESLYSGLPEKSEVIMHFGRLYQGATDMPADLSDMNPGESVSRDFIFFADRALFDYVDIHVRLVYMKLSDQPVPMTLDIGKDGKITASFEAFCPSQPKICEAINITEFTTKFSLW